MYSALKRKKLKTKQPTKLHGEKIMEKETIMVTLNIKPSRVTTNRATHGRNTVFSVTVGLQ